MKEGRKCKGKEGAAMKEMVLMYLGTSVSCSSSIRRLTQHNTTRCVVAMLLKPGMKRHQVVTLDARGRSPLHRHRTTVHFSITNAQNDIEKDRRKLTRTNIRQATRTHYVTLAGKVLNFSVSAALSSFGRISIF